MSKRPTFSSYFLTLITMIGVAVGLGNVWRFPYMMGKYGGSAFLFVYLIFTLLFAVPALMGEVALGKAGRKGIIGSFQQALGTTWGRLIGFILMINILIASSYYVVVIANVIYSACFAAFQGFSELTIPLYVAQLNNGWLQYGIAMASIFGSLYIIARGVKSGIEAVSKIFVPFFLVVIVYLIFSAFSLEGSKQHFLHFLKPDFKALKVSYIFAALGQAFYSLSLGGTFMVMYGSYIQKEEKLPRLALFTSIGDVSAALLAGLFIVPTILVFGLDMTSGPQLIFSTLPHLFSVMPGGQVIGTLFLIALAMVAFLSLVGALDVIAGAFQDVLPQYWSRFRIIFLIAFLEVILVLPNALKPEIIGVLDMIFGSGMQVIGSGLALIALSWGFGKARSLQHIFGEDQPRWQHLYYFWIKWVIPSVLLIVLIGYIYSLVR